MTIATEPDVIDGDGVRLRAYRAADADDVAAACADPLTQRFIPTMPHPYTRDRAMEWIDKGAPAAWSAGGAAYAIVDPASDRVIGGIGIERPVPARRQAEIGYWVAPWARGRGVATAATRALAEAAFAGIPGGPRVDRLELLTEWENAASQRVALSAGFQREGVRREAGLLPDGRRYDLVAFTRLATDTGGPVPRLLPDLPDPATGRARLTDGVVALRPLGPEDVDFFVELQSLPDVVATNVPPVPADRERLARRCARATAQWLAGAQADVVVLDAASGDPTGHLSLYYEQPGLREAMVAYSVLPPWRGRGYPTRALRLLSRWAFTEAGIARLYGGTLPDNVGSQRVLEKAGYRREGVLRGQLPGAGGIRADDVVYGLLPADLPEAARPST
ncbi:GNAT family N-acetyltransferase [Plantactinospora sp. GCM10030261]|uniref:GNAT family N-acetyltransferase n=1 Tax=Plantactinospora sp. GCM10030261 TaxID=3273420 RepID=UPI00360A6077